MFIGKKFRGERGRREGTIKQISVWVPSNPVTLTALAKIADPWKRAVADAVRAQWLGGFLHEPCAVALDFSLAPGRYRTTAVFNLLKATIDGLSYVIFASSPSGQPGPWSREDFWITQLVAKKRMADREPGVSMELGPPQSNFIEPLESPDIQTLVPGSPPLWPGDQAGQQKVVEWRNRIERMLKPSQPPNSQTRLAITLRFQVEPERMNSSDLDNFCVPAGQAVANAVFGSLRHVTAIEEIAAEKLVASPDKCGIVAQVRYM